SRSFLAATWDEAAASSFSRGCAMRSVRLVLKSVAVLAMLAGMAVAPFTSALAQNQVFKASDVHALGYPTVEALHSVGRKLEQATNKRLSVQMFAAMQLGGEKEAIEQAQLGALQIARVSVGAIGPVVDDLNVFNLPFLFRNTEHMEKVIDGKVGDELL